MNRYDIVLVVVVEDTGSYMNDSGGIIFSAHSLTRTEQNEPGSHFSGFISTWGGFNRGYCETRLSQKAVFAPKGKGRPKMDGNTVD